MTYESDEAFLRRAEAEFLRRLESSELPPRPNGHATDPRTTPDETAANGASDDPTKDNGADNSAHDNRAHDKGAAGKGAGTASTTSKARRSDTEKDDEKLPPFPEIAWRGTFGTYKEAMNGTTETSDVAHFLTCWAAEAAALGRRVHCFVGDLVYPNVYLCFYGESGDKKTTAQRRLLQCNLLSGIQNLKILSNVGSTEGLADALSEATGLDETECIYLFYWEELAAQMARGRWSGSTVFEFMVQTFDCPPNWGLNYRRRPVSIRKPTPTILTATTPEWFWKQAKQEDFYGGFANRLLFLAGTKKRPLPQPQPVPSTAVEVIHARITALSKVMACAVYFSAEASRLWDSFYIDWENTDRGALLAVAVKRIPAYVLKLAMTYAADEATLPTINLEQLQAAIAVGKYAELCTKRLLDLQVKGLSQMGELEERFVRYITAHDGVEVRRMQQTLSKFTGGAEVFNKVLNNLRLADRIEIKPGRPRTAHITR